MREPNEWNTDVGIVLVEIVRLCPWCKGDGKDHDYQSLNYQGRCNSCRGAGKRIAKIRLDEALILSDRNAEEPK